MDPVLSGVASMIDLTLLRPEATIAEIEKLCDVAGTSGFKSVCVNPCHVRLCSRVLFGTDVLVTSVVGFPLGANTCETKVTEARQVLLDGAREIDMVMNIGMFKSGGLKEVSNEITEIVARARDFTAIVKVIIETPLLNDQEKVAASELVVGAGGDFVKTSTGFEGRQATVEDVRLIRRTVGPQFGVKAAGGIRSYHDLLEMVKAGANRIGTSSGIQILLEEQETANRYHS